MPPSGRGPTDLERSVSGQDSKVEEIAVALEKSILSGELQPGTVLRQEQLADEFAVSRTPIREALRTLEVLGLVTLEAHRGARVRSVSKTEIAENYLVRAELEGLAGRLAAERITPGQLAQLARAERRFAELTGLLQRMNKIDSDLQALTSEWLRANDEFHDILLDGSGSPFLAATAKATRRMFHSHVLYWPGAAVDRLYEASIEHHHQILEALRARDPRAGDLAKAHLLDAREQLDALLEERDRMAASGSPGPS
jgi:DNA-binding GntR family transcriptional regulator